MPPASSCSSAEVNRVNRTVRQAWFSPGASSDATQAANRRNHGHDRGGRRFEANQLCVAAQHHRNASKLRDPAVSSAPAPAACSATRLQQWSVVQLAEASVLGARAVPSTRALCARPIEPLDNQIESRGSSLCSRVANVALITRRRSTPESRDIRVDRALAGVLCSGSRRICAPLSAGIRRADWDRGTLRAARPK
jgi:hypothetical protein